MIGADVRIVDFNPRMLQRRAGSTCRLAEVLQAAEKVIEAFAASVAATTGTVVTFGTALGSGTSLLGEMALVFRVLDNEGSPALYIGSDTAAVRLLLSALMGADKEAVAPDTVPTRLEVALMAGLCQELADAVHQVSSVETTGALQIEPTPMAKDDDPPEQDGPVITCDVAALGLNGRMVVVASAAQATQLAAYSKRLAAQQPRLSDPAWPNDLANLIGSTRVVVEAVLTGSSISIKQLARLAEGSLIQLGSLPMSQLTLERKGHPLFICALGKTGSEYSLSVMRSASASDIDMETEGIEESWGVAMGLDSGSAKVDLVEQPRRASDVGAPSDAQLESVLALPVTVKVVIGSATVTVTRLMSLEKGAVLSLDRRIGEPLDMLVGGRLVARGELVVDETDMRFGLRVTELIRRRTEEAEKLGVP